MRTEITRISALLLTSFSVWAQGQTDPARGWLVSRTTTLTCHLRDCELQPSTVRGNAAAEWTTTSPGRGRPSVRDISDIPVVPQHETIYNPRPVSGGFDFASASSAHPFSTQSSRSPSISGPSRIPSPARTDSTNWSYQPKRARLSRSSTHGMSFIDSPQPAQWSKGEQAHFETSLARLTASAGFPLRWVENPEWLAFCERWMPNAKNPSRKVLTQRLIPATLKEFKTSAQKRAHGCEVTASCDGWTGANRHHFIAFMVTCNGAVCKCPCTKLSHKLTDP